MDFTNNEKELLKRGYDEKTVKELSSFDMDYTYKVRDIVIEKLTDTCTVSDNPTALYIGGQPGSGKSTYLRTVKENWVNKNVICIIGLDNYRIFHPHYEEIEKVIYNKWKNKEETENDSKGNDMAYFTSTFAGIISDLIIERLTDFKYNIAIEWGMRSPLVPLQTMERLYNKGYKNIVKFIVVDKYTSMNACKVRDDVINNHDIIMRRIPNYFHEDAINSLPTSSEQIYIEGYVNKKIIDEFYLIDRDGNILWDTNSEETLIDTYKYYINNKTKDYENDPKYSELSYEEETKKE